MVELYVSHEVSPVFSIRPQVLIFAAMLIAACGGAPGDTEEVALPMPPAEDLVDMTAGKADSGAFSPNKLMDDHLFVDSQYLTVDEVQAFFDQNPYGSQSYLAGYEDGGQSAAEIVMEAATEYGINPIVLLTKLQVETSLVYANVLPPAYLLQRAMGCGCHDGGLGCSTSTRGFQLQVQCAAAAFRGYIEDLDANGKTVSGWRVGSSKYTLDDVLVIPENKATAALYTYTPWVLPFQGGNWLFRNVYLKFNQYLLLTKPNHHWIGGACTDNLGCAFDEGVCRMLSDFSEDQGSGGFCTRPCEFYCPDSSQPNTAQTFCADLPGENGIEGAGWCISKCDRVLYSDNDGCPSGFTCLSTERHGDPDTVADACMPDAP